MELVRLSSLCRICLITIPSKTKEFYSFEEALEKFPDTSFAEAFLSCTGCHIRANEPQKICIPCATELKLAFDLRVKCQQTQETLDKLLKDLEADEEDEDKKTVIQGNEEMVVEEDVEAFNIEVLESDHEYEEILVKHEIIEEIPETKEYEKKIKPPATKKPKVEKSPETSQKQPMIKCRYCDTLVSHLSTLRAHCERFHLEKKTNVCPYCNAVFFKPFYEAHIPRCSKNVDQQKIKRNKKNEKQICPYCGDFRSGNHIRWHIEKQRHVDAQGNIETHPFICDICGTRKTARSYMLQHMKNEHLNELIKCKYCPEEFKHLSTLRSHERRTHTDKVPLLQCQYCEFKSATHSALRVHIYSRHTGEKKHQCDVCYAQFVTKWKLTEHMSSHTNETPYVCEQCNGRFKSREGIRRHQNKIHGMYIGMGHRKLNQTC